MIAQQLDQEVQEEPEELTMTEEEFEAEKRRLLRKAVIAETQYKELRARLYENKKKEAAHYREMVVQQKCPIFLRGKADADKELKKKLDINETRYELKMAQIQDEFEAEMLINETQHDDQYAYAKGRFITFYEELIAEKDKRREHIELTMGALLTVPPQSPKANNDSKNEESDGGEGTSAGESSSIA